MSEVSEISEVSEFSFVPIKKGVLYENSETSENSEIVQICLVELECVFFLWCASSSFVVSIVLEEV